MASMPERWPRQRPQISAIRLRSFCYWSSVRCPPSPVPLIVTQVPQPIDERMNPTDPSPRPTITPPVCKDDAPGHSQFGPQT